MATQDQPLLLTLPAEVLDLGCLLQGTASPVNTPTRTPGNLGGPEAMDAIVNRLLTKVRKDADARKAFGLRRGGKDGADTIRLKAVAFLSWQSLRLSEDVCDLGTLAVTAADPRLPPAEALLRARHEIGVMLAEDTLIGTAECGDRLFSKVHLPAKTLEWVAGGSKSRGGLTPRKLCSLLLPQQGEEVDDFRSSGNRPIPSVPALLESIRERVIRLDDQVRALSSRLVMHLARASLLRKGLEAGTGNQAILLVGNSGCGKTHLMEAAAAAAGCPFASMSATAMTSEGYVGGKLDDLFKALLVRAKGNLQAARFGIAFADEWDKKAIRYGRDLTTLVIQQEVLVPMQGAEFPISGKRAMERPCTFNSRGTFFAFAGVFAGLPAIMKKRRVDSVLGFAPADTTKAQTYVLDALCDYGYVKEFVNRLTSVMWLPDPTLASLERAAANGILDRYNILLGELGIVLFPQPGAIQRMAEYALESRTFYRGVTAVWGNIAEMLLGSGVSGTGMIDITEVEAAIARISSGGVGSADTGRVSSADIADEGMDLSSGTAG